MSLPAWVAFVVAAASGAVARYLTDRFVGGPTEGAFPWGTFVINVSGSFVLGVLTGLSLYHAFPTTSTVVLGTGFCGAYTTFSTFSFETVGLLEEGTVAEAFTNALATVVLAAAAAAAGVALAAR